MSAVPVGQGDRPVHFPVRKQGDNRYVGGENLRMYRNHGTPFRGVSVNEWYAN